MHFKKDRGGYTCGKYGKFGKKYCSSHFIKATDLLVRVTTNLRMLTTGSSVKMHKLSNLLRKESEQKLTGGERELGQVETKLTLLTKKQSSLLDLLNENDLTKEEWRIQNELVREETLRLAQRKAELLLQVSQVKDLDDDLDAFEKQVSKLLSLDIDNEKVLKQVIDKLITKVEVFGDGNIKISYNITDPRLKKV
jgi:site-specific DNA recombinase